MANEGAINSYFLGDLVRQQEFSSKTNILFLKNIPIIVADRSCLFSYQLGLGMKNWYDPYFIGISPNNLGLEANNNPLRKSFTNFLTWSIHLPQRAIIWDPVLLLFMYGAALGYGIMKKEAKLIGFVTLIIANVPVLAVIGVSNDYRYLYMMALGIYFIPALVFEVHQAADASPKIG
jgi:hypothetical protein